MIKKVLTRIESDTWADYENNNNIVGETLTDALSYIYRKYNVRIFTVDASQGIVSIDDGKEDIEKIEKIKQRYSLYE